MKSGRQAGRKVDLVVVGSIGLDTIRTPSAGGKDLLGGSVSYACGAASFFSRVGMVGIVGDDFPRKHEILYARLGIDLAGLTRARGRTFRWSGVYEENMDNRRTLSTELNVFASFKPDLPPPYRSAGFLLLANISPELQLRVLSQIERPRFILADTMDLWINMALEPLMEVISRVDMLALNESEARLITGERSLLKCARTILGWGPRYVAVKKGEHGSMLFSRNRIFAVPAYPVSEVRDPTGAGDAFAGAFMGKIAGRGAATEADVREAILYGSAMASFCVEQFGLRRLEKLTGGEIKSRAGKLAAMMKAPDIGQDRR